MGATALRPAGDARAPVWGATLAVVVFYAAAIVLVDRFVLAARLDPGALRLALAFGLVQIAAVVLILKGLMVRRRVMSRRARRAAALRAEAGALVAEHAAGTDRLRRLRQVQRRSARDVRASIRAFLASTRGTMQARVAALASDLGIDPHEPSGIPQIEELAALSLRDRAIAAGQLAPHAERIVRTEFPRRMTSDARTVIALLDLLRAWRRALPVEGLETALAHGDPEVRWRACEAVVYAQPSRSERLRGALRDPDARVRAAAADAARRLRDEGLREALEGALSDPDRDVAVAAALALATLPHGIETLQAVVTSGSRIDASVSFEALEKAALGRLESV